MPHALSGWHVKLTITTTITGEWPPANEKHSTEMVHKLMSLFIFMTKNSKIRCKRLEIGAPGWCPCDHKATHGNLHRLSRSCRGLPSAWGKTLGRTPRVETGRGAKCGARVEHWRGSWQICFGGNKVCESHPPCGQLHAGLPPAAALVPRRVLQSQALAANLL